MNKIFKVVALISSLLIVEFADAARCCGILPAGSKRVSKEVGVNSQAECDSEAEAYGSGYVGKLHPTRTDCKVESSN